MNNQGLAAYYWSSSPFEAVGSSVGFTSININSNSSARRATGFSVRCFKN